MAAFDDTASMALFCDFENIALGVRDAQYEKFDIRPVLERLLAKGSIVVKKAYCDWERYKGFKAAMHEANFELIEIPHVRQSGKNSADIRMVVDALDLCYTKAHVDTFVIISGDSDFSPLVSKLRENAKRVIGVGVKQSCSDLLVTNCDEFIYYDDLVRDREGQRPAEKREREKRSPEEEQKRREKQEERKRKAVELVATTFADLIADRGDSERVWASVLKEVVKRRNPGFNESYFGFRTFGNLLEEAAQRGLLGVGRDEKSGTFVTRQLAQPVHLDEPHAAVEAALENPAVDHGKEAKNSAPAEAADASEGEGKGRRRGRRGRGRDKTPVAVSEAALAEVSVPVEPQPAVAAVPEEVAVTAAEEKPKAKRTPRRSSKKVSAESVAAPVPEALAPVVAETAAEPAKKRAPRARKPKKTEA